MYDNDLNNNPVNYIGRRTLYTDVEEVTDKNVKQILRDVINLHEVNRQQMTFLLEYEGGNQPLKRVKTVRPDIDIHDIDNVANEITNFKRSYHWGNPITLVQRGNVDSGSEIEPKAIALLNECFSAENVRKKTAELSRYVEITGVGYTALELNTRWKEGKSPFTYSVIDPRYAFVVRSSRYADHRVMVGVTYRVDSFGNRYFTAITENRVYIVKNLVQTINGEPLKEEIWTWGDRSGEPNPFGMINIIEWVRDVDRMGCFERQIPEMDALNIIESDFANDVDQNTQAIWHANDVEPPKDENGNDIVASSGQWIYTETTMNGKTPFVKPLTIGYDYGGMLNNVISKRQLILQKCNVPQRNDNSGGSTGVAMSDATGWTQAEVEATKIQGLQEDSKMQEVEVALEIIKLSPYVPQDSPLRELRYVDVKPNVKRQKTYEMTTKINAYATGVAHGIAPEHMIYAINFFDDPQQVVDDSKEYLDLYINSVFKSDNSEVVPDGAEGEPSVNRERLAQDESDQQGNSPMIDGMRTE